MFFILLSIYKEVLCSTLLDLMVTYTFKKYLILLK
ncbi:Uncharacterised protein [Vibrio furnissii]|nr:Uncharacterised protein [Vibrio furnissii]